MMDNETMTNEIVPTTNTDRHYFIDDLTEMQQKAIFMRLEGADNFQIAKITGFSYGYVKNLFFKGGLCFRAYRQLRDEMKAENRRAFKKIVKKFEEGAARAERTLYRASQRDWKAAVEYLGLAGMVKVQKIKAEVNDSEEKALRDIIKKGRELNEHNNTPADRINAKPAKPIQD